MITETPDQGPPTSPTEAVQKPPTGRAVIHRKLRVDQVHRLDLAVLRRHGALDPAKVGHTWHCKMWLGLGGVLSDVVYGVGVEAGRRWLALGHIEGPEYQERLYPVELTATPCHFGGQRWWFWCPLRVGSIPCRRRCRILYRPYGARYFGCRECWRLTYRCRQLHRNVAYEGPGRTLELLDEMTRHPRLRSRRKVWLRAQRMERCNRATRRFLARMTARLAKAPR